MASMSISLYRDEPVPAAPGPSPTHHDPIPQLGRLRVIRDRFTGLWRHPEFLKLWAASGISDVGSQVPALALPLIAAVMLGATAWQMGLLSAASSAPVLLVYYVNAISVRQSITPDRLRGRVNATMRFAAGGALPIGALIGGALGGVIGLPLTLVVAELGTLLPVAWLLLSPVRRLRTMPAIEDIEAEPCCIGP
jgi:hypothetical protein